MAVLQRGLACRAWRRSGRVLSKQVADANRVAGEHGVVELEVEVCQRRASVWLCDADGGGASRIPARAWGGRVQCEGRSPLTRQVSHRTGAPRNSVRIRMDGVTLGVQRSESRLRCEVLVRCHVHATAYRTRAARRLPMRLTAAGDGGASSQVVAANGPPHGRRYHACVSAPPAPGRPAESRPTGPRRGSRLWS